ncbi:hypothetical protein [Deinococcus yavapaiensis]|uniref:DUF3108 domain-containing protein n=1 Tax=Deinococcus yavapaiensis KR-236 TaxID=694435 RepID=A0A318S7Y9_9DEIO|nr:hypothetical protein [Deinococcus yavapaiensis]PYE51891.1 hypothetical protein DES52_11492 [Deinococcus yavapaiensis KR-236]
MRRVLVPILALLAVGLASASECDNPFSPVEASWQWTYRTTSGDAYTVVRVPTGPKGFSETSTSPNAPGTRTYACSAGEQSPKTANIVIPGFDVTVLAARGTAIAAPSKWAVGESWSYTMDLEATLQGLLPLKGAGQMTVTFRVVAQQRTEVPAGTFEAFKVEVTRDLSGRAGFIPFRRIVKQTSYYAPGVGMIREETERGVAELSKLHKN